MSTFTAPLKVEILTEKRRGRVEARVIDSFEFYSDVTKPRTIVKVDRGFVTDFASTPRWSWVIIPPLGKYAKAAVVHDFLYTTHIVDRKTADKMFLEGMRVLEVPIYIRYPMFWSVCLFGGSGYKKDGKTS